MPMEDEQVNHIIAVITTVDIASEAHLRKQLTKGFQEVKTQLQSLVNVILENIPKVNMLQ